MKNPDTEPGANGGNNVTVEPAASPMAIWDIVILAISLYSLVAIAFMSLGSLSKEVENILYTVDYFVCGVFLLDFSIRFARAESKWRFMRWGWVDLLASIPVIPELRAARLLRIFRILRLFRGVRSAREMMRFVSHQKAGATLAFAAMVGFFVVLFGSILVLEVEKGAGGPIETGGDALWWSFVTVTTVGYGDMFPVTPLGRAIATVLMVVGVGIFGSFSAFVASIFLSRSPAEEAKRGEVVTMETVQNLVEEVRNLRVQNAHLLEKVDSLLVNQRNSPDPPLSAAESLVPLPDVMEVDRVTVG